EKIHRIITHYLEYDGKRVLDKKSDEIEDDFKFIRTSSEQIYNVLEKMRSFKHLRYSNGNKSIKNVIDEGLKIIAMSNNNFTYKVDEKLNKYTLLGNLKNADLLSIILNHLKNSLEADASQIVLMFVSCHKNVLTFRIIDNGKGIPADVLDTIFDANVSTKSGIRGNGLYLNKHILNAQGGDVEVVQTSKHGTTIEISIMCKDKD
ncbi:MAG: ATP-binding protein, partial [Flavobacteriaceae bacterium]|nr:ATP-binding protein [Flavobacteriaceae bacterium]